MRRHKGNENGCSHSTAETLRRNFRGTLYSRYWTLVLLVCIAAVTIRTCQGRPPVSPGYGNFTGKSGSMTMEFLMKYGYLPVSDLATGNLRTEEKLRSAIKLMQKFGNIPQTGVIDEDTMKLMQRRRCGVPDVVGSAERVRRYALQGQKWPSTNITWSVKEPMEKTDPYMVRNQLSRAFKVWADASVLTFEEVVGHKADIVVSFLLGSHGDGYPFDGEGSVLAHAFFPGEGIGGDAHFDAEETWLAHNPEQEEDGVNFFAVAAHEIGHSLGLSHSSTPGSLMFPYYQVVDGKFRLPDDDANGIQQLYGAKESKQWATMPTAYPTATTAKDITEQKTSRSTTKTKATVVTYPTSTTIRTIFTTPSSRSTATSTVNVDNRETTGTTVRRQQTEYRTTWKPIWFRTSTTSRSTRPTTLPKRTTNSPTKPTSLPTKPPSLPTKPTSLPTKPPSLPTKPSSLPTKSTSQPRTSSPPTRPTSQPTRASSLPTRTTRLRTRPTSAPTDGETTTMPSSYTQNTTVFPRQPSTERSQVFPTDNPLEPLNEPPDTCDTSVDAVSVIRREVFLFKDEYFWRLDTNKRLKKGYPVPINRFWFNLPQPIRKVDALYERPTDTKIVFFTGRKYWLFSANVLEPGYPRPLTDLGLPSYVERIDAAVVWGHNGKTYFFSGNQYWKFDEVDGTVELDYPRDMSVWRGVPEQIDAAFQFTDGNTYFLKGKKQWRFNDVKMKAFPMASDISKFWFGCKSKEDEFLQSQGTTTTVTTTTNSSTSSTSLKPKDLEVTQNGSDHVRVRDPVMIILCTVIILIELLRIS